MFVSSFNSRQPPDGEDIKKRLNDDHYHHKNWCKKVNLISCRNIRTTYYIQGLDGEGADWLVLVESGGKTIKRPKECPTEIK